MNVTAILTKSCNLRCTYCFEGACGAASSMSEETALRVCDFACSEQPVNRGISFFGGEPLLKRELIEKMVEKCSSLGDFRYNMTTNGVLLDESFVRFAEENKIHIALSHDGLAHDMCRVRADGTGSKAAADRALELIKGLRGTVIMLTTTPGTVRLLSESVFRLWDDGGRRVLVAPDGRPGRWDDESLEILRGEYEKIAAEYKKRLLRGDYVRFPSFDVKIADRVRGENHCNSCRIGYKQPIIDTDGSLYPCIQFNSLPEYRIGDIWSGFDEEKRREHLLRSLQPVTTCEGCAIADRCRHSCPCANFEQTGNMNTVSPFTCTQQRYLIESADRFAEELYSEDEKLFMTIYGKREEYPVEV